MACTTLLWGPPLPSYNSDNKFSNNSKSYCSILLNLGCYNCYSKNKSVTDYWTRQKQKKKLESVCCSGDGTQRWFSDDDDDDDDMEQGPPQEAVLKAISEVSRTEGRVGQTTNVVIGGTVTDDSTNEWISLDQKVNSYPTVRDFTAIGTGGDDFVEAMVVAVESVTHQPVPEGRVKHKLSSTGKYISVSIGPVHVVSSEQVQAVYNAMRRDDRMKYFL